jgi:hypothetical protein
MIEQIKKNMIKIINFIKKTDYLFYIDELNEFKNFEVLNFNNKLYLLNLFWSIYYVMNLNINISEYKFDKNILKHLLNCISLTNDEKLFLTQFKDNNNYNINNIIIFEIIKNRYIDNNNNIKEYDQETKDLLKIQHISMESQIIPFQFSHLNSNISKELKIENINLKDIKIGFSLVYGIYQDIIGFIFLKDKQILGPFIKETYYDILYSYLLTKMLLNINENVIYSFYGLNIENDIEKFKNILQILNYDFNIQTKTINGYSNTISNIYYIYEHHDNKILIKNNIPILKSIFNDKLKYSEIEYKLLLNILNIQNNNKYNNIDKLTLTNNLFQIILFNEYNKKNIQAKKKSLSFFEKFYDICKKLIEQTFVHILVFDVFGDNITLLWYFIMNKKIPFEINNVEYTEISDIKLLLNNIYPNENFDDYFNIISDYYTVISDLIKYENNFISVNNITNDYEKKVKQILKAGVYTNSDFYLSNKEDERFINNILIYLTQTLINKFLVFRGNEVIGNEYYKNYEFDKVIIKDITDQSRQSLLTRNKKEYDLLIENQNKLMDILQKTETRSFKIENNSNYLKYIKQLKVIFEKIFKKDINKKDNNKKDNVINEKEKEIQSNKIISDKDESDDDDEEEEEKNNDPDNEPDENDISDQVEKKTEKRSDHPDDQINKNPKKIFYKELGIKTVYYKMVNGEKLLFDLEYWKDINNIKKNIKDLFILFDEYLHDSEKIEFVFGNNQNVNEFFMNFPNEIIKLNTSEILTLKKYEIKKEIYFTVEDSLLLKSIENLYLLPKQMGLIFINKIINILTEEDEEYIYKKNEDIFLKKANFNNFIIIVAKIPLQILKSIIELENGANYLKIFFTCFMQKYKIKEFTDKNKDKDNKMDTIDTSMNHLFHLQSKIESFITTNIQYNEIILETFQNILKKYDINNLQNTNLLLKLLIISLFKCKAFKIIKNLNQKIINSEKLKDIIIVFQRNYLNNKIFKNYDNWSIIIKEYKNEFINILGSSYLLKILYLLDSNNIKIKSEAKEKLIKSNISIELIINDFH